MPITNELRFIGTGKPARASVNPKINREPSRKGVQFSNIESQKAFQDIIKSELLPSIQDLGRNAVEIIRGTGIDITA